MSKETKIGSQFDAYDVIGVITPGSILLFGFALLFPALKGIFFDQGFSLGDLGLFLLLSFVAGHLLQAVGNLLEKIIWTCFGGKPTDWLIKKPQRLIHVAQVERLRAALKSRFDCDLQTTKISDFVSIVREMYAVVQAEGKPERIDSFNRTYGLMRGVSSAFTILAAVTLVTLWPDWRAAFFVAVAAVIAGYRMVRFGKGYGRELVVEFLRITASKQTQTHK